MRYNKSVPIWGISSAGRAQGSQSWGQGFDPPMLHQLPVAKRPIFQGVSSLVTVRVWGFWKHFEVFQAVSFFMPFCALLPNWPVNDLRTFPNAGKQENPGQHRRTSPGSEPPLRALHADRQLQWWNDCTNWVMADTQPRMSSLKPNWINLWNGCLK